MSSVPARDRGRYPAPQPIPPADDYPDRGLAYSAWLARERAGGRPTRPAPQPHNAGITPGYSRRLGDHKPATRRQLRRLRKRVRDLEDLVLSLVEVQTGGAA